VGGNLILINFQAQAGRVGQRDVAILLAREAIKDGEVMIAVKLGVVFLYFKVDDRSA
jgi:hypothetical protein